MRHARRTIHICPVNEERIKRRDLPGEHVRRGCRVSWMRQALNVLPRLFVFTCAPVHAAENGQVEGITLGIASAFLTIPYAPTKMIYAGQGGIVDGFAWFLTGGNTDAVQTVWDPRLYGTYVITPDHLRNTNPFDFSASLPTKMTSTP